VTKLGHVQRGGAAGAFDRLLATRFGVAAVEQLEKKNCGALIGLLKGEVAATSIEHATANKKRLNTKLLEVANILARCS
jgi:6-phosphofructokinase 1